MNYVFSGKNVVLEDGTYTVKDRAILLNGIKWEQIPYEEIGRYKSEDSN